MNCKYHRLNFSVDVNMNKPLPKALWIDPELHAQILCLADFQRRSIKAVVERILKRAIREEAEKSENGE